MFEVSNLSFTVTDGGNIKQILSGIDFSIKPGTFLAITGPNGSGKSSLAQIIMGLKMPTSGKIHFKNQDISNLSITERAKLKISFAFQKPVEFKGLNVYDLLNIANGELLSRDEAYQLLKKVGLSADEYLLRDVDRKLSGGELKRIEMATILARNADLMIFDEPEAGIDLWSFDDLFKVFKEIHSNKQKMLIVISHQQRILELADQVMWMQNGKIVELNEARIVLPKILEKSNEF